MKILILNPHVDAAHEIVQLLKARGDAVLVSSQVEEAWKILQVHGPSIDLAIIHREGRQGGDPGVELIYKIKKDASLSDLPFIFTTEAWNDEQCANHQHTPMGANAYLHWPFAGNVLTQTLGAIFSTDPTALSALPEIKDPTKSLILSVNAGAPGSPPPPEDGMILEDPSVIFSKTGLTDKNSIQLKPFESTTKTSAAVAVTPPSPSFKSQVSIVAPPAAPVAVAAEVPPPKPEDVSLVSLDISSVNIEGNGAGNPAAIEKRSGANQAGEIGLDLANVPASQSQVSLSKSKSSRIDLDAAINAFAELSETAAAVTGEDPSVDHELPYLFDKKSPLQPTFSHPFVAPVGDSIVPGGAAHSPDVETLKKYLLLREQDVGALSGQLKAAKEEAASFEARFKAELSRAEGLELLAADQKHRIDDFDKEKQVALDALNAEIAEIKFQSKAKNDKAKLLEIKVNEATEEIERLKERVRADIRKIRVRERELENKLELTKKDSEAVLNSRESKIVELKRKIDLLEFNMDLLQDRFSREKEANTKLREKLSKAIQVVRVAEGLLDDTSFQAGAASLTKNAADSLTENNLDALSTENSSGEKAS